jgi:hypothetical protein
MLRLRSLTVLVGMAVAMAGQPLPGEPAGAIQSSANALAASSTPEAHKGMPRRADFDGDGVSDLAVAAPGEALGADNAVPSAGVVHVLYGTAGGLDPGRAQTWSQDSPGVPDQAESGDQFGFALATGDFDRDGFTDLAIGTPFEDLGPDDVDAGAVTVLYGSARGLSARRAQLWTQDSRGIAGVAHPEDRFGYALAVGDFGRGHRDDLAIGVPRERVPVSESRDGGVNLLYGSALGLRASGNRLLGPTRPPLRGVSAPGSRWGAALAAGNFGRSHHADLAVGAPSDSASSGAAPEAGSVTVIYGSRRGLTPRGYQRWTQDTPGVADGSELGAGEGAEENEYFGLTLAAADFGRSRYADLAIGVPAEIIGYSDAPYTGTGAGAVNVLYGSPCGLRAGGSQFWSQDSPGIEGTGLNSDQGGDISGDGFGYALAVGNLGRSSHYDLAVGVPGESPYNTMYGGALNVIYGGPSGLSADGNQSWDQGSPDVPGDPDSSHNFAAALAAGQFGRGPYDDLAVGIPGDGPDFGDPAGALNVLYGRRLGLAAEGAQLIRQTDLGAGNLTENGDAFGASLQSE